MYNLGNRIVKKKGAELGFFALRTGRRTAYWPLGKLKMVRDVFRLKNCLLFYQENNFQGFFSIGDKIKTDKVEIYTSII